jgi:hypothetical protein
VLGLGIVCSENILDEMMHDHREDVRAVLFHKVMQTMPMDPFTDTAIASLVDKTRNIFTCNTEQVLRTERILLAVKHRWEVLKTWTLSRITISRVLNTIKSNIA